MSFFCSKPIQVLPCRTIKSQVLAMAGSATPSVSLSSSLTTPPLDHHTLEPHSLYCALNRSNTLLPRGLCTCYSLACKVLSPLPQLSIFSLHLDLSSKCPPQRGLPVLSKIASHPLLHHSSHLLLCDFTSLLICLVVPTKAVFVSLLCLLLFLWDLEQCLTHSKSTLSIFTEGMWITTQVSPRKSWFRPPTAKWRT